MVDSNGEKKIQRTVGARIKELRQHYNLNGAELSRKIGISRGQLSKIETGKTNLSIEVLHKIGILLKKPLTYFFQSETENPRLVGALHYIPSPEFAGVEKLIKEIKRRTNNKVSLVQLDPKQLGSSKNQVELLRQGVIDIFIEELSFCHAFVPIVNIFSLPYVFNNEAHLTSFLKSDFFQQHVHVPLMEHGIRLINNEWNWHRGVEWVLVSTKQIVTPDDVKGLRVRIYDSPVLFEYWKAMGAKPLIIPWDRVKEAWRDGQFDFLPIRKHHIYPYKVCEVGKYVTLLGDVCPRLAIAINQKKYDNLPPSMQREMGIACTVAGDYYTEHNQTITNDQEPLNLSKYNAIYLKIDLNPWKKRSALIRDRLIKTGIIAKDAWFAIQKLSNTAGCR